MKNQEYRICNNCVMDTTDCNIEFDQKGICNHCRDYKSVSSELLYNNKEAEIIFDRTIEKIKTNAGKYHCILGISGGVDSSYLACILKKLDLNVLLVHFDYGWNSKLAVKNIRNIIRKTGFDLETYVMDWEEFKDLQRSYFKASVLDLDVPADHMIFGALYKTANKYNIKNIISGNNIVTEWLLPKSWNYSKFDLVNLKNIQKKYGSKKLNNLPAFGVWEIAYYKLIKRIEIHFLLDLLDYNKSKAKKTIQDELSWVDYGGKHYESVFTRFYQGYILPYKYNIDKRRAHLSNLILSGQISRKDALLELESPSLTDEMIKSDKEYMAKKLDFSMDEFEEVLNLPNVDHAYYGTDKSQRKLYFLLMKLIKPITWLVKKLY